MHLDRLSAACLLAAMLAFPQTPERTSRKAELSQSGSRSEIDSSPFGFSCDNQTTYTLATYCPQMAKAGIRWIRGFPTFNVLEPERGRFDWSSADAMMATAASNKMTISGLFFYNAPWIGAKGEGLPVADLPAWSEYVSQVVTHCKARVKYWEVWNETPNFIGKSSAADYARTVVSAYDAAKAADPTCQVGLSIQSQNVNWIEQTIQAGAKDHFDFIAVHPYETLGVVESDGWNAVFMGIVPTLRKMLAARNPGRANVPVWFTEIGREATHGESSQAAALIKAFTMAIAQGVIRVNWFEGKDGDSGPMGLLRADRTPRIACTAMSNLTRYLGANPRYIGWVLLDDTDTGFVFGGASETVMVAWARPQTTHVVRFGSAVKIVDPLSGAVSSASSHSMTSRPVLVIGVPAGLVKEAGANKSRPFPWGGDYSGARSVSVAMGSPNTEKGLHQLSPDGTSADVNIGGGPARDCSKSGSQTFAVDPNFLSYATEPITITAVVRRVNANDNAGFNLKYESTAGWKNAESWYTVPEDARWHTQSWAITDAQFVGKWGYHFSFDSDGTNLSKYYLQSVSVTKAPVRRRALR